MITQLNVRVNVNTINMIRCINIINNEIILSVVNAFHVNDNLLHTNRIKNWWFLNHVYTIAHLTGFVKPLLHAVTLAVVISEWFLI